MRLLRWPHSVEWEMITENDICKFNPPKERLHLWLIFSAGWQQTGPRSEVKVQIPGRMFSQRNGHQSKKRLCGLSGLRTPQLGHQRKVRNDTHSPAPFISVCVDIFSLPEVNWQETTYDALLLCVDRHSSCMIAQPSMHKGLTAEKCAHLLLDGGWTQFGVPSTITSDQGQQFVGQLFVTMCSRLDLRELF